MHRDCNSTRHAMTISELIYLIYGIHYVSLDAFSESKPNKLNAIFWMRL